MDEEGRVGWGEASLEGHTQAVEGCLDAYAGRVVGMEAEYVCEFSFLVWLMRGGLVGWLVAWNCLGVIGILRAMAEY